ncbi:hypothetical protein BU24DRAFT_420473 [Aaosphaeria arxii CBS 175.79]|uniref:Uncharacterized protein n=1 Tax=Aaosphaeria arxii CBS 175.79 TaxID=1450172 RepID=A0A6A5XVT4_9PLEO|nr:uncharacterized protein BU24DRAFT_420473 [Aaosphaeria arxii CBS 175.79]KAF2017428.1 hypothetical protein BU24DRAFT_420473 [Aaosphaeria arxii CBS 175.79]
MAPRDHTRKLLSQQNYRFFKLQYSASYSPFIQSPILSDFKHPLHPLLKRTEEQREGKGLWWHVTTNFESSKTKVVRSWLRRRLHNAFLEELKERDITEDGTILRMSDHLKGLSGLQKALEAGQVVTLTGSIRMQAQNTLVTAKYAEVRKETGSLVDALLKIRNSTLPRSPQQATKRGPQTQGGKVPPSKQLFGSIMPVATHPARKSADENMK